MAAAQQRSHEGRSPLPHPTWGEDLTEAAPGAGTKAKLTETESMVHRTLDQVQGTLGAHDLVHWRQTLTVR